MAEPHLGTKRVHVFVAEAGQGALEKQTTYLGEVVAGSTNERRRRAMQHPRQGKQQGVVRNLASNNSGLLKVRGAVQAGTDLQHRHVKRQLISNTNRGMCCMSNTMMLGIAVHQTPGSRQMLCAEDHSLSGCQPGP